MRASTPCTVQSEEGVVLEGTADLQSGPRGWRATLYAASTDRIKLVSGGRYLIELPSGTHEASLSGVHALTREIRLVGRGPAPAEIARRRPPIQVGT